MSNDLNTSKTSQKHTVEMPMVKNADSHKRKLIMWTILTFIVLIIGVALLATQRKDSSDEQAKQISVASNDNAMEDKTESTEEVINTLLPLGDGKVSNSPKSGYVYSCQTDFMGGAAENSGDWIIDDKWDPSQKEHVQGDVNWPNASIVISEDSKTRTIKSNGLPTTHNTGIFPISSSDPAYQYDRNPNSISQQSNSYSLPLDPSAAATPGCVPQGAIGVMLNGVAIFSALDAAGRDAAAHEVQDKCDGHPERSGAYHYHSESVCVLDSRTDKLVGYAFDGYGVYGNKDSGGETLTSSDLDECHGITSVIDWDGAQVEMYHYVLTRDYPYAIGCYHGTSAVEKVQANR